MKEINRNVTSSITSTGSSSDNSTDKAIISLRNIVVHYETPNSAVSQKTVEKLESPHASATVAQQANVVVDDISLDIQRNEFVSLVGKSGCGKTTLLNVIAGLVAPTGGQVEVLGKNPIEARESISYMFARDCLLPWRKAIKNIELSLEGMHLSKQTRQKRAIKALERVGLEHAASKYPHELSQGMRQRVALARTWVRESEVVLMDEPFASLDAQTREELQSDLMLQWQQDPHTVIFVTHDLNEALFLSDRVIVIGDGKIKMIERCEVKRPRKHTDIMTDSVFINQLRRLRETLG